MDRLFFLVLVGTAVEMTVCFLCAHNLWRKRAEAKDNSRLLLGLGALICGLLSLFSLLGNLGQPVTEVSTITILQPWVGLVFLSMHIFMTLYPITVVRPDWLTPRLFLPVPAGDPLCRLLPLFHRPMDTPILSGRSLGQYP